MAHVLDALFRPRAVAIIGASSDADKLGGRPLAQNIELGFPGRLHPVNPGSPMVQGLAAAATIDDLTDTIDCAIVAVPAAAVEAAITGAARKGAKVAVVFSSGYAEHDAAGMAKQLHLAKVAREAGIRVLGPNSMGALSLGNAFSATFTTVNRHYDGKGWPRIGNVSIASQSGAVGTQLLVQLRDRGAGIAHWVATGNQCDLDVADAIDFYAQDEATKVIAVYLEGATDGRKLIAALERARGAAKPVVVLKVGRSEAGAKAVASHTASLAGADAVYDAVFRRCGAIRANSLEHLVDIVAACSTGILPRDETLGLVTNSGGIGVLMADTAAACGLVLPDLPEAARQVLRGLAPFAVPSNPADTGAAGMGDIGLNTRFAKLMLEDVGCASVSVFLAHLGLMPELIDEIAEKLFALRDAFPDRVICTVINTSREWQHALLARGVLAFDDPTRAIATIAALAEVRKAQKSAAAEQIPLLSGSPPPSAGTRDERAARQLLQDIGIPVIADRLATTAAQAADAAEHFAGPVAMKIVSPDIAHKSDAGGVLLGLTGAEAARAAYDRIIANVGAKHPDARIDGVLVSPMVQGGIETIVGVSRDPVFGPVVMFGMGGIFVEIYKDTVLRLAPFGEAEARAMIREVAGFPLLDGARGRPKADVDALAKAIATLAAYAATHQDTLSDIDCNPLIVLPEGRGVVAVDALIITRQKEETGHDAE